MYKRFIGTSYDMILSLAAQTCRHEGMMSTSRNGAVKDLPFSKMIFTQPRNRYSRNPARKHNILALMAETIWVLGGSNHLLSIADYLPRVYDFSDDGETWRAGYGPRIRNWSGDQGLGAPVDQVARVIELLKGSPDTRQAVINIWEVSSDGTDIQTKDRACNNRLSFRIIDGLLFMNVDIRSNDLVWGNMINFYEWSVLHELIAAEIGTPMGDLIMNQDSLHAYEHHWERLDAIADVVDVPFDKASNRIFKAGTLERVLPRLLQMQDITAMSEEDVLHQTGALGIIAGELVSMANQEDFGYEIFTLGAHLLTRPAVRATVLGRLLMDIAWNAQEYDIDQNLVANLMSRDLFAEALKEA